MWAQSGNYTTSTLTDSVGIGTATPTSELQVVGTTTSDSVEITNGANIGGNVDVAGAINGTGDITTSGNLIADSIYIYDQTNAPTAGDVLTAIDASGKAYWSTPAGAATEDTIIAEAGLLVTYGTDTVLIGMSNSGVAPGVYGAGDSIPVVTVDSLGRVTNVAHIGVTSSAVWNQTGNYVTTISDSVGIGTAIPSTELHVVGTTMTDSLQVTNNAAITGDLVVTNNITTNNDVFVPLGDVVVTTGGVTTGSDVQVGGNVIADSLVIFDGSNVPTAGQVLTAVDATGKTYWANSGGADNLGNHIMTDTLKTSGQWIKNGSETTGGLFIDAAGQVGIGTAAPIDNFELRSPIGSMTLNHTDGAQYSALQFAENGTIRGSLGLWGTTNGLAPNDIQISNQTATGHINFNTKSNLATPVVQITSDGDLKVVKLANATGSIALIDAIGNLDTLHLTNSSDVLRGDGTFGPSTGDNLGNHTATSNIQLGANFISNDGTNAGISITGANEVNLSGNLNSTNGSVILTNGSVSTTNGSFSTTVGSVTAGGNISSTTGGVSAVTDIITSTGDLEATNGNVVAPSGTVTAGGNITSGGNVIADSLVIFDQTNAPTVGDVLTAIDGSGKAYWASVPSGSDNLGNHIMTDTLKTSGQWIKNASESTGGIFVDGTGQVGIGTNIPSTNLNIVSNSTASIDINVSGATNNAELNLVSNGGGLELLGLKKHGPSTGGSTAGISLNNLSRVYTGASSGALMMQVITNNPMYFVTDNTERMRITPSGEIGIGETNPSQLLDVAGNARFDSIYIYDGTNAPVAGQVLTAIDASGKAYWAAAPSGADNLGDHNMSDTLETNGNWISNDGGLNEGIFVHASGDVGFGTALPGSSIEISRTGEAGVHITADTDGSGGNENAFLLLSQDAGATQGFIGIHGNANALITNGQADAVIVGSRQKTSVQFATDDIARMIIDSSGRVGIGVVPAGASTYALEVAGTIKSSGINEMSDRRWKKNITTLDGSLDKVMNLRGVSYDWRRDEFPERNFENKGQIGLIAQEVEILFPELVDTGADGFKSVEYSKMVAVLIEAIKEQQKQIQSLENQVSEFDQLKAEIDQLKVQINGVGTK